MHENLRPEPGDWVKLPDCILQFKETKLTELDLQGLVINRKVGKDKFDFANLFLYVLTPSNKMLECLESNLEVIFR